MKWTADFETITNPEDCRVWASAVCPIENPDTVYYGNSIDWMIKMFSDHIGDTFYFHNLKFDGEFIISYLLNNGWKHNHDSRSLKPKQFNTLISDKGQFYSMKIKFNNEGIVTIIDSLKIIPFSVDQVAKTFGLPVSKLSINYDEYREPGHILTKDEIEYLRNDVRIMAMALKILFDQGLTKMTQGSNALNDYKNMVKKNFFKKWFPVPEYDEDVRQSYKGGFTYLNKQYEDVDIQEGIVLDVNSLYPSVMHGKPLPYGEGKYFPGSISKRRTISFICADVYLSILFKRRLYTYHTAKKQLKFCANRICRNFRVRRCNFMFNLRRSGAILNPL